MKEWMIGPGVSVPVTVPVTTQILFVFLLLFLLEFPFQIFFVQLNVTLRNRSLLPLALLCGGGDIGEWCIFFWYQTSKSIRIKSIFYQIVLRFHFRRTFKAGNMTPVADRSLINLCMGWKNLSDFLFEIFWRRHHLILCFARGQPSVWNSNTREKPTNMCHILPSLLNHRKTKS